MTMPAWKASFHSLKVECIHVEHFASRKIMRTTVLNYIECDCNRWRFTIVFIPGFMLNEILRREFETYLPPDCNIDHASVTGGRIIHDVEQHLITLLPEKFSLIGFLLGGYIARQLAADFPERMVISCIPSCLAGQRMESNLAAGVPWTGTSC